MKIYDDHMHFGFVPMAEDNRVCAKEVMNRNILRQIQEELPKHCRKPDLILSVVK